MSVNLDMDMGAMVKKLFASKSKESADITSENNTESQERNSVLQRMDNPLKKPILIGVSLLLLFGAFMAGVYSPYYSSMIGKKVELMDLQGKQDKLSQIEAEANALQNELVATKQHYVELLNQYNDHDDLGGFYESISNLAQESNLIVLNIKESAKTQTQNKKYANVVKETEVEVELEGKFNSYMSFKDSLSSERALLNIRSEAIKVSTDAADPGKVLAKLKLLVYTIDKQPFMEIVTSVEGNDDRS